MTDLLIIGAGGALGALARYGLGRLIKLHRGDVVPGATLAVNIIGAILLGAVVALRLQHSVMLFCADGFLGGFTTYSTFMAECYAELADHRIRNAVLYIAISFAAGIIGYGLALVLF